MLLSFFDLKDESVSRNGSSPAIKDFKFESRFSLATLFWAAASNSLSMSAIRAFDCLALAAAACLCESLENGSVMVDHFENGLMGSSSNRLGSLTVRFFRISSSNES